MIVTGICCAMNEQDIIEPFVRHNLTYLDYLYITDNGSVDRTGEILTSLQSEFPQLFVIHDDHFGNFHSERMTSMYHHAVPSDYIVPLDADEFLSVEERSCFSAVPHQGYGIIYSHNFICESDADDPPRSLILCGLITSVPRIIISARIPDLVIGQGQHSAWIVRNGVRSEVSSTVLAGITSLHYPVRSKDQFISKIITNWMSYLAFRPDAATSGMGMHKRDWFRRICQGDVPDIRTISETYSGDDSGLFVALEAGLNYERKYSDGKPMPALQLIAKTWEQSLW